MERSKNLREQCLVNIVANRRTVKQIVNYTFKPVSSVRKTLQKLVKEGVIKAEKITEGRLKGQTRYILVIKS